MVSWHKVLGAFLMAAATTLAQDYVIVGTTRYDYQHNGSYGKMIAVSADGVAHGAYMGGVNVTSGRRVQAWCVDPDLVIHGPTDVSADRTGYVTVAATSADPPNNLAPNSGVVGFHTVLGSWFGADFGGCSLAFNLVQGAESADFLWPHISVDYQDHVHMVCGDAGTVTPDAVWYNASTDGAYWDSTFVMVSSECNTWGQITAAAKHAPGAAVLFLPDAPCSPAYYDTGASQWHHDVCLFEARDVNNDIHAQIAEAHSVNVTNYNCVDSTAPFRCGVYAYTDVDAVYDAQETPNLLIAFSTPVSMPDTTCYENLADHTIQQVEYIKLDRWHSAIWFHNATSQVWGHVAGWLTADGEAGLPDDSMRVGTYRCAQDRVQLAHDPETGHLYALWNVQSQLDLCSPGFEGTRRANGELYMACSADGGLTWGPRVNISNTPSPDCHAPNCLSENWASLAEEVQGGFLHITYMLDRYPGAFNDPLPIETDNPYYYLRIPVAMVPPHTGEAWDAAGHIGLGDYRRSWDFTAGHPDTVRIIDPVAIFNEGTTTRHLMDLTMYHDPQDEFGDAESDLWVSWGVLRGDPVEPQGWIADPASVSDWDGRLPAQRVVLTQLSVGHRGLPLREQAFKFSFDDGTERLYRYVYRGFNGEGSRVELIDLDNLGQYQADTLYHNDGTGIATPAQPAAFALLGAAPNPFNPSTEITYRLAAAGEVRLTVHNLLGERVATLVDGPLPAGAHRARFDGSGLASGLYLCTLEAEGRSVTQKLLLTK